MPSKGALLLCILFIFVVFLTDSKQKSNVSSALWIPLIWMMLCGSRALSYWLNSEPVLETEIDYTVGNPIDRAVLIILIVIGLFILYRRKMDWSQILKSNAWILMLFLYMGFSILWSDFKGVSFKRWIKAIGDLIMVLIVLTEHAPFEALKRLVRRSAYVLIPLSILCIKYFREIGVRYSGDGLAAMWVGITTHKNELGILSCICASFFLWNVITRKRKKNLFIDIIFLLSALYLLAGSKKSYSATSIVVFIVGICIFMGLYLFKSNLKYIGRNVVLIGSFFLLFLLVGYNFLFTSAIDATGRDMTFTGRTYLWADLIDIGSCHPILGTGYGSFWIGDLSHDLWDKFRWKPKQAHNGYIDVYVELGLLGVFLLVIAIYFAYKNIMRDFVFNFEYGRFRVTLLTMILVHNITESSFLRGTNYLWFLFLLVAVNSHHISNISLLQETRR